MYCKHCGKEIADDAKFCMHCGDCQEVTTPKQNPAGIKYTIKKDEDVI